MRAAQKREIAGQHWPRQPLRCRSLASLYSAGVRLQHLARTPPPTTPDPTQRPAIISHFAGRRADAACHLIEGGMVCRRVTA